MKIFSDMDLGDAYLDFLVVLNFPLSLKLLRDGLVPGMDKDQGTAYIG